MIPEELPAGNAGKAMMHILYCMNRFYRPRQDEERLPDARHVVFPSKKNTLIRLRVAFPTLIGLTAASDVELWEIRKAVGVNTSYDEQAILWFLYSVCVPVSRYPTAWRLLKCYRPEDRPAYQDAWSKL